MRARYGFAAMAAIEGFVAAAADASDAIDIAVEYDVGGSDIEIGGADVVVVGAKGGAAETGKILIKRLHH